MSRGDRNGSTPSTDPKTIIDAIETTGVEVNLHHTDTENALAFQEASVLFFVESISCGACAARIEYALKAFAGIHHVHVSKKQVTVLFDPQKTNPSL